MERRGGYAGGNGAALIQQAGSLDGRQGHRGNREVQSRRCETCQRCDFRLAPIIFLQFFRALVKVAVSYYITARKQLNPLPGKNGSEDALQETVRSAFCAQVDYVQLRESDLASRRLAFLVEDLRARPEKKGTRLLVNERMDVAVSCGADGVHLPSGSLPLSALRVFVGDDLILGISCHGGEDVQKAVQAGACYVLLGPVFETPSKPGTTPLGLAALAEVCRRFPVPVFALGGVVRENAKDCIQAGAAGVAGIRIFQQAQNLEDLCGYLRSL